MTDIEISLAVPDDAPALADLGMRTFTEKFGYLYSAEDLASFLAEEHSVAYYDALLANTDYRVWKAVTRKGVVAGYSVSGKCSLDVDPMPDGAMELKRLYVDAAYQSAGLGRRFMDEAVAWIDRDGRRPIYLSVYKYNNGAQRFYGRYGFKLYKEVIFMVGNHADPEYLFVRPV